MSDPTLRTTDETYSVRREAETWNEDVRICTGGKELGTSVEVTFKYQTVRLPEATVDAILEQVAYARGGLS